MPADGISVIPVQAEASTDQKAIAESQTDSNGYGVERGAPGTCTQSSRLVVVFVTELCPSLCTGSDGE